MDAELQEEKGSGTTTTEEQEPQLDVAPDDPLAAEPDLQAELVSLYEKCCGEDRYARLVEVKDVKQAEFYWGGRQYIWWSTQDKQWNLPTTSQGVAFSYGDTDIDDMPRYEFVTNIYQARGLMVIAAVAGAPPRVRFFPDDADDPDDLETAEGRTKLAKVIERWNPPQILLQEETYHAYTGGFIAWWIRYVEDEDAADRMGKMEEEEEQPQDMITCHVCGWTAPAHEVQPPVPCPQCGTELTEDNLTSEAPIPTLGGEPEESEGGQGQGKEVVTVFGALNCKRPQHVSYQNQMHYFAIEEEIHYSRIRKAFPEKADKIKPGMSTGAEDVHERNARLAVAENTKLLTQTGSAQANLCTFARVWFRDDAFWMIDDEVKRNKLLDLFPKGCRVEICGKLYCRSKAERMDDAIVMKHALPGRGQHRNGVGTAEIPIQDQVNTMSNIEMETYEYGIPITYRASDTFSSDADEDQRAAPGLEVEVNLKPTERIQDRISMVRADSVSPDMYKHNLDLIGPVSDQITGTYPALTGAGAAEGAPETLGQQTMQRNSAMGRMGIYYVNLKQAHAEVLTLACRDYEAHAEGEVKIPVVASSGDFESESVDVSALEGDATAYPEGDENFPDDWNGQRATMMQIMDTPYGQALAQDPENAELFAKMTAINGLKIPGLNAWRKQLKEIAELTKLPSGEDLIAGVAPMVEVDSDDYHDIESKACKWWLNSEKGQRAKRENPLGFQAVKEHKAQHDAQIPPAEPQQKPLSPSITTAFKDMPPEAQAQWLEKEFGIKVDPQAFLQQVALEAAKKRAGAPAPGPARPGLAAPQGGSANLA